MTEHIKRPLSLKIIAALFIVDGVLRILTMFVTRFQNSPITPIIGIITLFAGCGLLTLSSGWRTFILVILWFYMIYIPSIIAISIKYNIYKLTPVNTEIFQRPLFYIMAYLLCLFLFVLWMYRVLTRPEVRKLFTQKQTPKPQTEQPLTDQPTQS
ncbi:hypothetical protein STSP2_00819 [Anaerohalosphaera lusitana]|uniref:Uncharacterized protein n=1 Tax=Anaerohalosphaera lusitana TaxID=1936003 RepID=A0A1U9NIC7_9BACT|nr:hypothetical protein [Anaerohalosphaera lusitana]AQT67671.1 hypothetical protein STSP2_00819 [Anaerohalosphaera lusitana]